MLLSWSFLNWLRQLQSHPDASKTICFLQTLIIMIYLTLFLGAVGRYRTEGSMLVQAVEFCCLNIQDSELCAFILQPAIAGLVVS